jgi:hypothetical protein
MIEHHLEKSWTMIAPEENDNRFHMDRDLRKYSRQTTIRLIIGVLSLLFLVGGGLILAIYGPGAMSLGLLCMLAGLLPVFLITLILWLIDWILKRDR